MMLSDESPPPPVVVSVVLPVVGPAIPHAKISIIDNNTVASNVEIFVKRLFIALPPLKIIIFLK